MLLGLRVSTFGVAGLTALGIGSFRLCGSQVLGANEVGTSLASFQQMTYLGSLNTKASDACTPKP